MLNGLTNPRPQQAGIERTFFKRTKKLGRRLAAGLICPVVLAVTPLAHADPVTAVQANGIGNPHEPLLLASRADDLTLLDFSVSNVTNSLAVSQGSSASWQSGVITLRGPNDGKNLSWVMKSGSAPWNAAKFLYVTADIYNAGAESVTLVSRVEDPDYAGWHHFSEAVTRLPAGQTTSVLIFLKRKNAPDAALKDLFPGMHALPDGYMPIWSGLDPQRISKIVFTAESSKAATLEWRSLRATGICDSKMLTAPDFFPFIDRYGQFRHADWPTKIHSPNDFATQRQAEATSLRGEPRPEAWDQYGGFKDGPKLSASGHFRVEKYQGKWWLVDPEGRLFWSHGVTGVGFASSTSVKGRRNFFSELPPAEPGESGSVSFYRANLKLKYGSDLDSIFPALTHQRLQSWGLNTMASWSDAELTRLDRTPYTRTLGIGAPKLAPGLKLPDPFDPAFAANARQAFEAERDSSAKDPWCIGYFIANELEWRSGPDLVNEVLTAPAKGAGKQALVRQLQKTYPNVAGLNAAWHTRYASWDALLQSTNKVNAAAALKDFTTFNEALADRYYQTCEAELKRSAPNKLNLGSRFHTVNPIAVRAAARYCDVVSFNKYATSIRNLDLPDNLDRPVIVGEFHFPAWDRSFTADASRGAIGQKQRADAYWYYVTGALDNPLVVGTHWFQYLDQPLTGRSDGENAPIGFVDVTDTPYEELTAVTRDLGANLYSRRLGLTSLISTAQAAPSTIKSQASTPETVPALAKPAIDAKATQTSTVALPPLKREEYIYKRVGPVELKVVVVKPPGWKPGESHPAIVLFHGGGWVWGTPNLMNSQAIYFARRGMVSVLVQYRLLGKETKAPPTMCVQDAKSAMRWVRAHAGELAIDPERIAASGGSAGGHLAAFVSMVEGQDAPDDDLTISPKGNALILFNPVFNNGPGSWGHELVGDRYREFSPAHNITSNAPPTIVFLGTKDPLIPMKTVEEFQAGMKRVGVRCDTIFYEGQVHGFFNKDPWRTQTLLAADKFLTSLGWLKGDPAVKEPVVDESVTRPKTANAPAASKPAEVAKKL